MKERNQQKIGTQSFVEVNVFVLHNHKTRSMKWRKNGILLPKLNYVLDIVVNQDKLDQLTSAEHQIVRASKLRWI